MVADPGADRMVWVCGRVEAVRFPEVDVGYVKEQHSRFFWFVPVA
jgi:hypothetical protein